MANWNYQQELSEAQMVQEDFTLPTLDSGDAAGAWLFAMLMASLSHGKQAHCQEHGNQCPEQKCMPYSKP